MKNIKNTRKIVQQVLEQNKQARDSDDLLYIKVCEKINPQSVYQPLKTVFAMRETLNLPPFE
ncbi:MAG: hypothetical protein IKU28_01375, partial [Erysipelotrichaceae bacterium]|nr:hypothetical protein [Erysipelotrichaceae bacterium]